MELDGVAVEGSRNHDRGLWLERTLKLGVNGWISNLGQMKRRKKENEGQALIGEALIGEVLVDSCGACVALVVNTSSSSVKKASTVPFPLPSPSPSPLRQLFIGFISFSVPFRFFLEPVLDQTSVDYRLHPSTRLVPALSLAPDYFYSIQTSFSEKILLCVLLIIRIVQNFSVRAFNPRTVRSC
ncbi:hypothetical protein BDW62DRAFT_57476 [Aspergillus aurantiobrunneus]